MNKSTKSVDLFQLTKSVMRISGQNPKIKHQHMALIWYIIELSNSKMWQSSFTLYTESAMSVAGFSNSKTYNKTLLEIEELGFIIILEKCINQYTKNVIEICWGKFDEALSKQELDTSKANNKHNLSKDSAVPCIKNNKDIIKHIKENKLFKHLENDFFLNQLLEQSHFNELRDLYPVNSQEFNFINQLIDKNNE
ncbi:hypothetical protein [Plebeiibacterium marinum]|uniref:Uncharacterized protein n=1 Tax=Plebeiibacterium marinum TaxID=2992111 RepID=A0AAE3MDS1_9BACT|nr:hypothetical protein [Plebeiobacterium marinum]MCW3805746.1 hypothetical protein [Plebeiobacterium marinum]